MSLVGRKGKLSISESQADAREVAWQRYEDVLTADVFGAYRYLPPSLGLLPLLKHAVDESGRAFVQYLKDQNIDPSSLDVVRLRFWPTFDNGREPDVFALLASTQHEMSVALLVEAKLHAPQHEIEGKSQLGHYLIKHLKDAYADDCLAWELPQRPRPLLYITNHKKTPESELERARAEAVGELPDNQPSDFGLFWVNWATVGIEAKRLWHEHRDRVDSAPWLRHLLDLYEEIRDRNLLPRPPFLGISSPPNGRLTHLFTRTFANEVPGASLPYSIARRRFITTSPVGVFGGENFYARSYRSHSIELGYLPTIYGQKPRKFHDS